MASFAPAAAQTLKGVALIIGQSAYGELPSLPNPGKDARQIEALMARLGFATTLVTDATSQKLHRAIASFTEDAAESEVALIYYAGHGIEAGGINYLLPTDTGIASLNEAGEKLVSLQGVLDTLRTGSKVTILLMDACRSSPFPKNTLVRDKSHSDGQIIAPSGLGEWRGARIIDTSSALESIGEVIGFAAEPGHAALDGPADGNSPYAAALLKHLGAGKGYDFGQVMTMVTEEVYLATGTRQRPWTHTSLRQFVSFGETTEETASSDETLLTGERRKLLLSIAATPRDMRLTLESLARDQSLPLDPLYGMLRELQVDTKAGPRELDKQLRIGAENLKKLLAERSTPLRQDPELTRLAGLAERAQAEGALGLAKSYRAQASARADELDQTLDQRELQVKADRLELASTYADEAATATLSFDYRLAASMYAKAHEQAADIDEALARKYRRSEADVLSNHGAYMGEKAALLTSVEIYEGLLAANQTDASSIESLTLRYGLAKALVRLGERDRDTEELYRALTIYGEALGDATRMRLPLEASRIESYRGNTLTLIGERGNGKKILPKAVAAFESSLTMITRERAPVEWAETQNYLGMALASLGERESGEINLRKAVEAFESALLVYTEERDPRNWAVLQNNLGGTLARLGFRQEGTESLTRARAVLEIALDERARQRATDPLGWATTQYNLGNVYQMLGRRQGDDGMLGKAVTAYENALEEQTYERGPRDRERIEGELAYALKHLGQHEEGTANLSKARVLFELMLARRTRGKDGVLWADSQTNLGEVLHLMGQREGGTENLVRAIAVYRDALPEWQHLDDTLKSALTQTHLGEALMLLGERMADVATLKEAVAAFEIASATGNDELTTWQRARILQNLGQARFLIGTQTRQAATIEEGRKSIKAAWDLFTSEGNHRYDEYFRKRLQEFDVASASLDN